MSTQFSAEEQFSNVIGRTLDDARKLHPRYRFRAVRRDGFAVPVTRERLGHRVNVEVIDDKIMAIKRLG